MTVQNAQDKDGMVVPAVFPGVFPVLSTICLLAAPASRSITQSPCQSCAQQHQLGVGTVPTADNLHESCPWSERSSRLSHLMNMCRPLAFNTVSGLRRHWHSG